MYTLQFPSSRYNLGSGIDLILGEDGGEGELPGDDIRLLVFS